MAFQKLPCCTWDTTSRKEKEDRKVRREAGVDSASSAASQGILPGSAGSKRANLKEENPRAAREAKEKANGSSIRTNRDNRAAKVKEASRPFDAGHAVARTRRDCARALEPFDRAQTGREAMLNKDAPRKESPQDRRTSATAAKHT